MDNLLWPYYALTEEAIQKLGVDGKLSRTSNPGVWSLRKGETDVWVTVAPLPGTATAYFQVAASVIPMPEVDDVSVYKQLLMINNQLFGGAAFTLSDDWVWVKGVRQVDGMDVNEAHALISLVGQYADELRPKLEHISHQLKTTKRPKTGFKFSSQK